MPPAIVVAGPKLRTPSGPSAIFIRGRPTRGMSRTKKPSTPPSRSIFSSNVIRLRTASTRRSVSADEGDWASTWMKVEPSKRRAVSVAVIFRIEFTFRLGDALFLNREEPGTCERRLSVFDDDLQFIRSRRNTLERESGHVLNAP